MSDFRDTVGDLAHRAYDAISGALSAPSTPNKPASSSEPAQDWVSRAKSKAQDDRNTSIDKQISDNGG